jgi:ABC-2 type transport system permease protein
MLTVGALTAISGIFYPIAALAGWLQTLAHAFPLYWLGLGMRSALLPDAAAAAEIGGSWRPVETTLVLLAWAVAGLLLAPPILRRMARRESGSAMEERRHRAMQRVT